MGAHHRRYQVTIEARPTVPIVRMTRDFDATPAKLMRAHTDPARRKATRSSTRSSPSSEHSAWARLPGGGLPGRRTSSRR
jgi:hypothetical protein